MAQQFKGKTVHFTELPTLSSLGGWDYGFTYEQVQAFQFLRVRVDLEWIEQLIRHAIKTGKDAGQVLCDIAEREWQKQEKAA